MTPEEDAATKRAEQLQQLALALARKKGWSTRRATRYLERQITKAQRATPG